MYACFLIKILHVVKSRVANLRLALQSLGRKVIFLKTLLYATHNFRNDSERQLHHNELVYNVPPFDIFGFVVFVIATTSGILCQ